MIYLLILVFLYGCSSTEQTICEVSRKASDISNSKNFEEAELFLKKELETKPLETSKKILILTLPKSGTHLLKKILPMILDKDPSVLYYTSIDQDPWNSPYIPDEQHVIFNHVYPGFDCYRQSNNSNYIKVLLIRDPRDAILSFANWLPKNGEWGPWTPKEVINEFAQLSFNEQVTQSILFPDNYLGLHLFCAKAVQWMEDSSVFVCRFEDLVGLEGGGDRKVQEEAICALAKHLGHPLAQDRIAFIADNLFGDTFTFSKGQIGSWRHSFNDHHKKIFKISMGEELVKMGYENSNDW